MTLYRWEVFVDGNPGEMNWDMVLNTGDRDDQNAYHEYFLVMQTDFDEPFTIDALTVSAGFNNWWWTVDTFAEVTLENITLNAPFWSPEPGDDDDDDVGDDDDTVGDDDDDDAPITDDDDDDDSEVQGDDDDEDDGDRVSLVNGGCSLVSGNDSSAGLALFALLGLATLRRRS